MKRLVVCFDGTWNALLNPKLVTNVVKLANAVSATGEDGISQVVYYNSGVGSGGPIDRVLGALFGFGVKSNLKRGLAFLALNYEGLDEDVPDKVPDEIYLFGFSRGAYTARALGGVIGAAGIPMDFSKLEQHWEFYRELSKLRIKRDKYPVDSKKWLRWDGEMEALKKDRQNAVRYPEVPIKCVGVWDTVGSYGIPIGWGLNSIGRLFTSWTRGFRDTHIGDRVEIGLHAIAVDEMRRPYVPTLWTAKENPPAGQHVEQVWFPGVHSNIGGGFVQCGLSDLALTWMIAEVRERTGLEFNESNLAESVSPCSAATLRRPGIGWLVSRLRPAVRQVLPRPRTAIGVRILHMLRKLVRLAGAAPPKPINEKVHWSVLERRSWPITLVGRRQRKYAPTNLPARIDEVAKPTEREIRMRDASRAWDVANKVQRCPLEEVGARCQCRAAAEAAAKAASVAVAAPPVRTEAA
jgi:uncharacterized protein (DUF2235 family)